MNFVLITYQFYMLRMNTHIHFIIIISFVRARWRLAGLPIPESAESIQRHFISILLEMTQSFFLLFFGTLGGVPLWKKPLLQCRATVNETTNISLSRRSWRMMTQVILNQKIEKTWQIISINIYLQTTAENSPTLFWWSAVQCSFVQEWLLLLFFFLNKHFFSDSQYTSCMVIFLKMKLGLRFTCTLIFCVLFDLHYRKIDFAWSVKYSDFVHPCVRKQYPFVSCHVSEIRIKLFGTPRLDSFCLLVSCQGTL